MIDTLVTDLSCRERNPARGCDCTSHFKQRYHRSARPQTERRATCDDRSVRAVSFDDAAAWAMTLFVTGRSIDMERSSTIFVCIATCGVLHATEPLSANVFADNKIVTVPRERFPQFDGIGLINRLRDAKDQHNSLPTGFANAINVGPCSVVTNSHVAFDDDLYIEKNKDYRLFFSIGYAKDKVFARKVIIEPRLRGENIRQFDFSLSYDSSCSGIKYGYYYRSPYSKFDLVKNHMKLVLVWLDPDGQMNFSSGVADNIEGRTGYVRFSASTKPGSSGGAVFLVDDVSGELRLQGVNVGALGTTSNYTFPTYSDENANLFMSIEDIVERSDVSDWLARDLRDHPGLNPLADKLHLRK